MTETEVFLFVLQFSYNEFVILDDDKYEITVESDNEVEKGSNKLILALPNSEPKTYTSNWYFNYDDFKTKGNQTFCFNG